MKKIMKRFVAVLVVMTVFSTMFVSGVFASATTSTVDGDTTIAMASVVPSTTGQQTKVTDLTEKTEIPAYSQGVFTTSANYQYFEFKVDVTKSGLYTLYVDAISNLEGKRIFMYVDGTLCTYFGNEMLYGIPYGIGLSTTQSVETPVGSAVLNVGEHTVRFVVQTACEVTLTSVRFEYNTYLSNKAESVSVSLDNSERREVAYVTDARGFSIGGLKLSKLTAEKSYVEATFIAPKTGEYNIDFIGVSDRSAFLPARVKAYVDNALVNDEINLKGDNTSTLTTYNVVGSMNLTAGEHKLKLVAKSVPDTSYTIIPLTTVKLTYTPSESITVTEEAKLVSEQVKQIIYPKDITGITIAGADDTSGFVKLDKNGNISNFATKTIEEETAYYIDADGNYAFSAKHDGATKGCINIPIDVTAAGNYDVTVNYYISPVDTYTSTSAWLVKANEQILAYTNTHGTNGASNTDKMVLEAGSADFSQGKNTISFELSSLEKYARRIIIESIVLTPNSDRAFYVNPDGITVNSKSDIVSKSIAYNGTSAAPYVVTKYETTSAPTAGETYIEFAIEAPFDGNYTIAFDKVGALSGTKTGGKWNVSVNNGAATLVDFTRNYKSKATVSINSALKEGINTLKFVYNSTDSATGNAKQDYGFFLTGITVTPDAADVPEIADTVISTMPGAGTYFAYATVTNDTSDVKDVVIIAAVYDEVDGVQYVVGANYNKVNIAVGETKEISTPVTVDYGISNGSIKIFVWEDVNIRPVSDPVIID